MFSALAAEKGIKITANERYLRFDSSVTGQALKILAAKPDAVLVAAPGAASVLPQTTLFDQGYKGKFYQTHGAALPDFLKLGGKKVEGTILAASLMLVLPEMPDSNPSKKVAADYIAAYEKLNGSKPATFGANVTTPACCWRRPSRRPRRPASRAPRSSATRCATRWSRPRSWWARRASNMTAADHSGFDDRGRELITVKDGNWTQVK